MVSSRAIRSRPGRAFRARSRCRSTRRTGSACRRAGSSGSGASRCRCLPRSASPPRPSRRAPGPSGSAPTKPGAKRITSPAPHAPPRMSWDWPASVSPGAGRPNSSVTLRRFCAKKPILRPSGDQNGYRASVVPGSIFASRSASARIQSAVRPSAPRATKAQLLPVGREREAACEGRTVRRRNLELGVEPRRAPAPAPRSEATRQQPAEDEADRQGAGAPQPERTTAPGRSGAGTARRHVLVSGELDLARRQCRAAAPWGPSAGSAREAGGPELGHLRGVLLEVGSRLQHRREDVG